MPMPNPVRQDIASDGRIVLNRNVLKKHRRALGLSQEQLAFHCAEKGLCVSIASIKRAETCKNILYRTARDLAAFYNVELDSIVNQTASSQQAEPLHQSPHLNLNLRRQLVIMNLMAQPAGAFDETAFLTRLEKVLIDFGAISVDQKPGHYLLSLADEPRMSNPALRAVHLGKLLLRDACTSNTISMQIFIHSTSQNSTSSKHASSHDYLRLEVPRNRDDSYLYVHSDLENLLKQHFQLQTLGAGKSNRYLAVGETFNKPRPLAAFVGRQVELLQFQATLEATVDYATMQVVCLQGPAGIGKTRLLDECCERAATLHFAVFAVEISDVRRYREQRVLSHLFRSLLGIADTLTALSSEQLYAETHIRITQQEHLLCAYTWLGWPQPPLWRKIQDAWSIEKRKALQCQLLAEVISQRAQISPILIRLEDLHWGDQDLLEILNQLIPLVSVLPVLVVTSARPQEGKTNQFFNGQWDAPLLTLNLRPLPAKEAALVARQFSINDPTVIEHCIQRAEGNPLFLEQLLAHSESESVDVAKLPLSIQSLVEQKLNQLTEEDQKALCMASVIGGKISLALLAELLGSEHYSAQLLIDQSLLCIQGGALVFRHALIREGVYNAITHQSRKDMHFQYAQKCSKPIEMALHLAKAEHPSAVAKLYHAATLLISAFEYSEALNTVNMALEIDFADFDRSQLYSLKAELLVKLGDIQGSVNAYELAYSLAHAPEARCQALIGLSNSLNTLDRFEHAISQLDEAQTIAEEHRLPQLLAAIHHHKGNYYFPKGNTEICLSNQQKALAYARQTHNIELQARAFGGIGDAQYAAGRMESAHMALQSCLKLCEQHVIEAVKAPNLFMLGTVQIYRNETHAALENLSEAVILSETLGNKRAQIVSHLTSAWIYIDLLNLDQAQTHIDSAMGIAQYIGAKRFEPFILEGQSRIHFYRSDPFSAQCAIAKANAMVEALALQTFIGPWLLATEALCSEDNSVEPLLSKGLEWLKNGCVGHNYFRFCSIAMETCIRANQIKQLDTLYRLLESFTANEPTPWSTFYIDLARYYLHPEGPDSKACALQLQARAQNAGLLTASLLLNDRT